MDCRNVGSWSIHYTAIIELATIVSAIRSRSLADGYASVLQTTMQRTRSETGNRLGIFLYNTDYNVMYA